MKALSICQPWTWAVIHGQKRIENRTWKTDYRGRLVIHASRSRHYFTSDRDYAREIPGLPPKSQLVFGALIGTVQLVDCVPFAECLHRPYAEGPWCWILEDPRPLPAGPIPYRGQQALFTVPDEFLRNPAQYLLFESQ